MTTVFSFFCFFFSGSRQRGERTESKLRMGGSGSGGGGEERELLRQQGEREGGRNNNNYINCFGALNWVGAKENRYLGGAGERTKLKV